MDILSLLIAASPMVMPLHLSHAVKSPPSPEHRRIFLGDIGPPRVRKEVKPEEARLPSSDPNYRELMKKFERGTFRFKPRRTTPRGR